MKKLLMLTAVAMLTVGTSAGCRGGLGLFRDRCDHRDHCDPCCHACNVTTPIMGGAPETLLPSPAATPRPHNVLPGPIDGSSNG